MAPPLKKARVSPGLDHYYPQAKGLKRVELPNGGSPSRAALVPASFQLQPGPQKPVSTVGQLFQDTEAGTVIWTLPQQGKENLHSTQQPLTQECSSAVFQTGISSEEHSGSHASISWRLCLVPLSDGSGRVSLQLESLDAAGQALSIRSKFELSLQRGQDTQSTNSTQLDQVFTCKGTTCGITEHAAKRLNSAQSFTAKLQFSSIIVHTAHPMPGIVLRSLPGVMMISQSPRILLMEHFMPAHECEALMALAAPQLCRSRVSAGTTVLARTSSSTFLLGDQAQHPDVLPFEQRVSALAQMPFVTHPLEKGEATQVVRYQKGEFYSAHFDNKAGDCSKRAATVITYLSNCTAGGATYFPRSSGCPADSLLASPHTGISHRLGKSPGLRIHPKQGRAIMFWSRLQNGKEDSAALHSAEAVVQGEKWIATRWLSEQQHHEE